MIDANFFFKANTVFLPLNVVHRGKRNLTISSTELLLWKITTFRALTGQSTAMGPSGSPMYFGGFIEPTQWHITHKQNNRVGALAFNSSLNGTQ